MAYWNINEARSSIASYKTSCTSGAAETKGSWTEACASTPYDVHAITAAMGYGSQTMGDQCAAVFDIGVGPSGFEQILIPDIQVGGSCASWPSQAWDHPIFPVNVPKGTRVVVRSQTTNASRLGALTLLMHGNTWKGMRGAGRWAAYGSLAVYGYSSGSGVQIQGSAPWTEIVASTDRHMRYMLISLGQGSVFNKDVYFNFQVGMGAVGSERVIFDHNLLFRPDDWCYGWSRYWGPFPVNIPVGTRFAAKCEFIGGVGGDYATVMVYGGS